MLPVSGLLSLMVWGLANSTNTPGSMGINNLFGEVPITNGQAPSFSLPLLSGEPVDLEDFNGNIVMVDFWSSWCPPCIEEAPALADLYSKYINKGVTFIGVAIWDHETEINRHVERFGIKYPNAIDALGKTAVDYGVRGIPEKYFIDQDGRLLRKFVGPVKPEKLQSILDELLSQKTK